MTRYDRRTRILAAFLSAVAGYVDATGFMALGGLFVSFMSGNSTRLAVGLAQGSEQALAAAGLIGAFVIGASTGSLVGHVAGRHRRPAVLVAVAILLAAAAALDRAGQAELAIGAAALAMGAENAVFEKGGEVSIGLTYMTGALVKLGQHAANAFLGGDPLAWLSYLVLWLGLVGGSVVGALAFPHLGLQSLWLASGAALFLAGAAAALGPDD